MHAAKLFPVQSQHVHKYLKLQINTEGFNILQNALSRQNTSSHSLVLLHSIIFSFAIFFCVKQIGVMQNVQYFKLIIAFNLFSSVPEWYN